MASPDNHLYRLLIKYIIMNKVIYSELQEHEEFNLPKDFDIEALKLVIKKHKINVLSVFGIGQLKRKSLESRSEKVCLILNTVSVSQDWESAGDFLAAFNLAPQKWIEIQEGITNPTPKLIAQLCREWDIKPSELFL